MIRNSERIESKCENHLCIDYRNNISYEVSRTPHGSAPPEAQFRRPAPSVLATCSTHYFDRTKFSSLIYKSVHWPRCKRNPDFIGLPRISKAAKYLLQSCKIHSMSTRYLSVTEHFIPCQYIREYPHAVKSDRASLTLAVKQYRPLRDCTGSGSVTIIAAHANGFPKETYEPLFDDICQALGSRIHAIWIADCAHQGASGLLNESVLGDDRKYLKYRKVPGCF